MLLDAQKYERCFYAWIGLGHFFTNYALGILINMEGVN
jgi:hypothetical protein